MTSEEIERILQTVAENQAKHDEMHSRHSADIAEIDAGFAMLLKSQNRYEERLATISDIMHDLADKHLKNEERFADLAAAQLKYEVRQDTLEATLQMFEQFVRDFREETNGRFGENDRLFAETDKKLNALASAQAKTDEQINALIAAQTRTDEQIRLVLDRNGSATTPKAKAKRSKSVKKTGKKGSAK
ncbi:MAG: hypothetical protein MOB07_16415 [Acidobacteria bacterium]|nr:hypothetical protein [Acidobacteriota bacterium]